ncbi:hypothetical protein GUF49_19835, partial [Xanthomonas citri pv. citri]|nr:hypothetical protein [Xanthomonas citri pv. citri]
EFSTRVAALVKQREDIVNAQKLFNLDITSYPELNVVKTDLAKLQQILGLFSQLREFEAEMSGMLWSELDVHVLTKGAEDLEKNVRRLPKELK